jgi:hypothetical protein
MRNFSCRCEHWRVIGAPGQDQLRTVMAELRIDLLTQYGCVHCIVRALNMIVARFAQTWWSTKPESSQPRPNVRVFSHETRCFITWGGGGCVPCRYSKHGFLFKAGYMPTIYLQPYPQPEWSCYYPLSNLDTAARNFRHAPAGGSAWIAFGSVGVGSGRDPTDSRFEYVRKPFGFTTGGYVSLHFGRSPPALCAASSTWRGAWGTRPTYMTLLTSSHLSTTASARCSRPIGTAHPTTTTCTKTPCQVPTEPPLLFSHWSLVVALIVFPLQAGA